MLVVLPVLIVMGGVFVLAHAGYVLGQVIHSGMDDGITIEQVNKN